MANSVPWSGVSSFDYLKARSLYKGMSSPLLGVAGINAITFGAYGNVLRLLPDQESISSITLAGASAGLIQVTAGASWARGGRWGGLGLTLNTVFRF